MSLNLFKAEQALPLNKLRFLCFALCATNAKSIDNHRAHMSASFDANRVANSMPRYPLRLLLRLPPTIPPRQCFVAYE